MIIRDMVEKNMKKSSEKTIRVITVSGTPGTGKTTLAKKLAQRTGFLYLDVSQLIVQKKLSEGFDEQRGCSVVSIRSLGREIRKIINHLEKQKPMIAQGLIIDSHLSHHLPQSLVGLCIITRCELGTLGTRLRKRGYAEGKVRENLDSEIFDICYEEALAKGHDVYAVSTDRQVDWKMLEKRALGRD